MMRFFSHRSSELLTLIPRTVWTKQIQRKYTQLAYTIYNTNSVVILVLTCLAMRYNFSFLMLVFFFLHSTDFQLWLKRNSRKLCQHIHAFWILIQANKTHSRQSSVSYSLNFIHYILCCMVCKCTERVRTMERACSHLTASHLMAVMESTHTQNSEVKYETNNRLESIIWLFIL